MQEPNKETKRISVERCRELLGEDSKLLSDKQIEEARDALYMLGDNILDNYLSLSSVSTDHD